MLYQEQHTPQQEWRGWECMAKPPVSCSDGQLGQSAACTRHVPYPVVTSSEERKTSTPFSMSAAPLLVCQVCVFVWGPSHIYTMKMSSLRDNGLRSTKQLLKLTYAEKLWWTKARKDSPTSALHACIYGKLYSTGVQWLWVWSTVYKCAYRHT